jgi:hypothetical protein
MDMRESAARTATTAALLSGQVDGLIAAWERTIASAQAGASGPAGGAPSADPAAALAELEHQLGAMDRELAELREQADGEARLAGEWQGRAMIAVRDGRDDMARSAVRRQQEHRDAADALDAEVEATTELADAYRKAITTIRATLQRLQH